MESSLLCRLFRTILPEFTGVDESWVEDAVEDPSARELWIEMSFRQEVFELI